MRAQTEAAVADADAVLFLIDARVGLTPDDRHFAALLRRAGKPLILIANKAEGRAGEAGALEAYDLGLGEPVPLSAEHGEGLADLYDAIRAALPDKIEPGEDIDATTAPLELGEEEDGSELDPTKPLRAAIVGRPNAGKSTLINRILGEERLLTGPEAGITRDSIGLEFDWRGRALKLFDTAGLRKRARVEDKLEKLATADALRAVRFAEVVVLIVDATIPFEKQDLSLADLAAKEGRALVIALSKWDLIEDRGSRLSRLREEASRLLPQVRGAPVIAVSGATGEGIDRLMGRHPAGARSLEQAHRDGQAQSVACRNDCRDAAACRVRPPHQNPLHDAAEGAPAAFRLVRQSARRIADELRAVFSERSARDVRTVRRADPDIKAAGGESVPQILATPGPTPRSPP